MSGDPVGRAVLLTSRSSSVTELRCRYYKNNLLPKVSIWILGGWGFADKTHDSPLKQTISLCIAIGWTPSALYRHTKACSRHIMAAQISNDKDREYQAA